MGLCNGGMKQDKININNLTEAANAYIKQHMKDEISRLKEERKRNKKYIKVLERVYIYTIVALVLYVVVFYIVSVSK